MHYFGNAFKYTRIAFFVLDTELTDDGAFFLCVAVEGKGFYKIDLGGNCIFKIAKAQVKQMNFKLGLTLKEVDKIIASAMKKHNLIFSLAS